jgi:hypothetical protein
MKILAQCDVPDELANAWMQHLRDFDAAHPGCHFEVMLETTAAVPVREMVKMLQIAPCLSILEIYELAKLKKVWGKP